MKKTNKNPSTINKAKSSKTKESPTITRRETPKTSKSQVLRLLSFNIQAGIHTQRYRHYFTRGWQHFLPNTKRHSNLDKIGQLLSHYDLVALQEVDGGSLRSGFINQISYLAKVAKLPFWYQQLNRNLGRLGQHSNALLSRFRPWHIEEHKLPGLVRGRGALMAWFGREKSALIIAILHLALSNRVRNNQLSYIRDAISGYKHVIIMGDMNARLKELMEDSPLATTSLVPTLCEGRTYPSWNPHRGLDHILVSPTLEVRRANTLHPIISDHLPLSAEIILPKNLRL